MELGNDASTEIATALVEQRSRRVERGLYWESQIAFVYNSEKMEGNPLTRDQTRAIFETWTLSAVNAPVSLDHVVETSNHFRLFDLMLDTYELPLTRELLWDYHRTLKQGTSEDLLRDDIVVGGWKTIPNRVADVRTADPSSVDSEVARLLRAYEAKREKGYRDVAGFHVFFERIHPFQDGNGRVGRMVMFKECLRHGLVPFIVLDEHKARYYAALSSFPEDEAPMLSLAEDMADAYLAEFSSLVPRLGLLPALDGRGAPSFPYDGFFSDAEAAEAAPRTLEDEAARARARAAELNRAAKARSGRGQGRAR